MYELELCHLYELNKASFLECEVLHFSQLTLRCFEASKLTWLWLELDVAAYGCLLGPLVAAGHESLGCHVGPCMDNAMTDPDFRWGVLACTGQGC
jgi:hypothetical protein